jgi:hypothetical protein
MVMRWEICKLMSELVTSWQFPNQRIITNLTYQINIQDIRIYILSRRIWLLQSARKVNEDKATLNSAREEIIVSHDTQAD